MVSNCPRCQIVRGVKLSSLHGRCQIVLFCMMVSNCPRCQIVLLAWSVSNCPRCQIVCGVKLSHHQKGWFWSWSRCWPVGQWDDVKTLWVEFGPWRAYRGGRLRESPSRVWREVPLWGKLRLATEQNTHFFLILPFNVPYLRFWSCYALTLGKRVTEFSFFWRILYVTLCIYIISSYIIDSAYSLCIGEHWHASCERQCTCNSRLWEIQNQTV